VKISMNSLIYVLIKKKKVMLNKEEKYPIGMVGDTEYYQIFATSGTQYIIDKTQCQVTGGLIRVGEDLDDLRLKRLLSSDKCRDKSGLLGTKAVK